MAIFHHKLQILKLKNLNFICRKYLNEVIITSGRSTYIEKMLVYDLPEFSFPFSK